MMIPVSIRRRIIGESAGSDFETRTSASDSSGAWHSFVTIRVDLVLEGVQTDLAGDLVQTVAKSL